MWSQELGIPYKTVALLREEDCRVYIYIDSDNFNTEDFQNVTTNTEKVLYDFSNPKDEEKPTDKFTFSTVKNIDKKYLYWYDLEDLILENLLNARLEETEAYYSDFEPEINGKKWHIREFSENRNGLNGRKYRYRYFWHDNTFAIMESVESIIEGIGPIGKGTLHRPSLIPFDMSTGLLKINWVCLNHVYNMNGDTIFDVKWLKGINGVEEVEAPGQETDGASYDLSGKRVVNPEPGTIYIQDGKKHIAH